MERIGFKKPFGDALEEGITVLRPGVWGLKDKSIVRSYLLAFGGFMCGSGKSFCIRDMIARDWFQEYFDLYTVPDGTTELTQDLFGGSSHFLMDKMHYAPQAQDPELFGLFKQGNYNGMWLHSVRSSTIAMIRALNARVGIDPPGLKRIVCIVSRYTPMSSPPFMFKCEGCNANNLPLDEHYERIEPLMAELEDAVMANVDVLLNLAVDSAYTSDAGRELVHQRLTARGREDTLPWSERDAFDTMFDPTSVKRGTAPPARLHHEHMRTVRDGVVTIIYKQQTPDDSSGVHIAMTQAHVDKSGGLAEGLELDDHLHEAMLNLDTIPFGI